jgi:hypothetical protein
MLPIVQDRTLAMTATTISPRRSIGRRGERMRRLHPCPGHTETAKSSGGRTRGSRSSAVATAAHSWATFPREDATATTVRSVSTPATWTATGPATAPLHAAGRWRRWAPTRGATVNT